MRPSPEELAVPQVLVERLALGELSPEQATLVRQRLVSAGELHRLEALQADDVAILSDYPARLQALAITEREGGEAQARRRRRRVLWGLELAAVAAALVLFFPMVLPSGMQGVDPDITGQTEVVRGGERIKGDPALLVHRDTDSGPELLLDGAPVAPGDVVQLQVVPGDFVGGHALVVSIDGRGSLTRHFAGPLPEGGAVALPRAFQLDDAPDFERFVLVLDPDGPVPASVIDELRAGSDPGSHPFLTLTLVKEASP